MEIDTKREYKGIIAIEQLTARHIDRIMESDINKKTENYEEGIEGLIDLLSPEHEKKAMEFKKEHGVVFNDSVEGKQRYRALFRYIKVLLAEGNIVWKKSTYEIGREDRGDINILDDISDRLDNFRDNIDSL